MNKIRLMKRLLILIIPFLLLTACKNEPKSNIGSQDQDHQYRPYIDREQDIKNKDSIVIRKIRFLDADTKTMTDYYEDGKRIRIIKRFKNDLQDGKTTVYFPDGKLKEVQYFEAGKQKDKDTVYYDSGEIRFIYSFKNDKKNGWMYRYSKGGRQEFAALYKDDLVSEVIDSLNLGKK